MIKGLEAMVIESFTTARAYGVEDAVLASLRGDLSRHRLGEAGRLLLPARDRARPPPRRRGARGGRDRARGRADAVVGAGHRRAPGLGRRPRRRGPVRPERHQGIRAQPRLAHRGRPDPRQAQAAKSNETDSDGISRKTPGWLDWYAGPSKPRFKVPAGAVDAHCHVFGPGAEFPFAPERKYTPCDASQAAALCAARPSRLRAQRRGAGHLPRRRQPRDGRCAASIPAARRAASPPSSAASATTSCRRCTTPACAACASTSSSAWSISRPKDELIEIAGRIAQLGWHVVIYFEAVDLPELWDFFTALPTTVVVDHMGRPDVDQAGRRSGVRTVREIHARASECLVQGELPGAAVGRGPAGAERRAERLPRRGPVRAAHRRDLPRSRAVGHRLAASQPEGPHARRRPAGRFHPAHRGHARTAAQAAGRQPDAAVLARRS